jgi:hypothetical protein
MNAICVSTRNADLTHQIAVGTRLNDADMSLDADRLEESQAGHLKAVRLDIFWPLEHACKKPALVYIGYLRVTGNE